MASNDALKDVLRKLVAANHILHLHGAVDGFGHVSVRHPQNPSVYIMCGYMPPALVETEKDLIEYHVDGSTPVHPDAPKGYSERFIHGELFKRYPEIQAVVHSHAEAVQPYTAGVDVALSPMIHMAGFLGGDVKVWDITPEYQEPYQQDMLVNNEALGASLAEAFSNSGKLDETVVLMKRHGYTTFGPDIETAVYRAIYTLINAGVQTRALTIQNGAGITASKVTGLNARQAQDCRKMTEATQDKAWRLWTREVERNPLYTNGI
ncbi:class II aldolase and Adducin N-terminal domain-containing protein [Xylariaceae sp. FL0255]|nr:class II aldolase and Adducin N-terminal domain-containing protein [Xylariaceae sp. FL0255]